MVDQNRRPRILGTAITVAVVGAVAVAVYAGASLPGFESASSDSSSAPATPADSTVAAESGSEEPASTAGAGAAGIPADAFGATVNYVHDGDTLYLDDGSTELKVRLIGIDTPELDSTQRPDAGECYGEEARELLRDFLPEGTHVWASEDREPEDHYGRSLLYVHLDDGTFVNLAMIELGAAEALKVGLNDRYWTELRSAEDDAATAKLGMWGRC
ncbi:thermonuclease family protein [Salinibacterium sp. PAMC 21357]|uniref:thermonuclease family protein n=1 Tax=Salinibacterium sp. PAMC 21357 TaxID=1112215 RepID=UPI000288F946|nr:thermonuclease family protein [Salinibacterium sp. PAMC 21357]